MIITRRDFLKYCGISAAVLGLSGTDLLRLEELLANPAAPTVVWLQGAGCTGCSISFLNRISTTAPTTAADVLINNINLVYHPNLMAAAGQQAAEAAEAAYNAGNYILAVEGGVPSAYSGAACFAWTYNDVEVTFKQVVTDFANRAAKILCVGTCASWGGIPGVSPNPATIQGVKAATGKTTINISGCPPHPDWIVWAVVQLLLGNPISVDRTGRPRTLYGAAIHGQCPRQGTQKATTFGQEGLCLNQLGCRGPGTGANCPINLWNNQMNWCVGANAPCLGCTESTFPGTAAFYNYPTS